MYQAQNPLLAFSEHATMQWNPPIKPIPFPVSLERISEMADDVEKAGGMQGYAYRELYLGTYLTACRMNEILSHTKETYQIERLDRGDTLVCTTKTLKNRRKPYRIIPVPIFGREAELAGEFYEFIRDANPGKLWSVITPRKYQKVLQKVRCPTMAFDWKTKQVFNSPDFRLHPHFLRHCRLTHQVRYHKMNILELTTFAGWTSPAPAMIYVQLDWEALLPEKTTEVKP